MTARIVDRRLVVGGEPRLLLAGEFRNSSASNPLDHSRIWDVCAELELNTALVAIAWDLFEPQEGVYDYAIIDALLEGARTRGLSLVPLWFGSWKNGLSSYRPAWMKRDALRFPLVEDAAGKRHPILSTFSNETREADARAFAALCRRIAAVDSDGTVAMVQVENEVGILGGTRDHSGAALNAWTSPVPDGLLERLVVERNDLRPEIADRLADARPGASWAETFGTSPYADEVFQAFGYASFIEQVAQAGRRELDIPLFVNAWLHAVSRPVIGGVANPFGGGEPGEYPTGGPVSLVFPVWRHAAPSIDLLTPDIYATDFEDRCREFAHASAGLFIPEMRRNSGVIGDIHIAIGEYGAIGTSPFGVDGTPGELPDETRELIAQSYRALGNMSRVILSAQSHGAITGFRLNDEAPRKEVVIGGRRLLITRDMERDPMPDAPESWGLIAEDDEGNLVGTGAGFRVLFPADDDGLQASLEHVESGSYDEDGRWRMHRVLNGDETLSGEEWRFPYLSVIPGLAWGMGSPTVRILRCRTYTY